MNYEIKIESPLVEYSDREYLVDCGDKIQIKEEAFTTQYVLRANASDNDVLTSIKSLFDLDLPTEPNTMAVNNNRGVFWLSPDEWLFVNHAASDCDDVEKLTEALSEKHALVSEITGGQTILHCEGTHVRDVLAKGMMFDIHPSVFTKGQCAQTTMANAPLLVVPQVNTDDEQLFTLIIRRSFSNHIAKWLIDATLEFSE